MLEVYLDESESRPGPLDLLVIGGYLAPVEEWLSFSEAWNAILRRYDLSYFHTKELRSGNARLYRHLSSQQREQLLKELAATIASHRMAGFAVGLSPSHWKNITTPAMRSQHGSAYGICAGLLVVLINLIIGPSAKDEEPLPVDVFIEDGHANVLDAVQRIKDYKDDTDPPEDRPGAKVWNWEDDPARSQMLRISSVGVVSKNRPPAQVADLLAYSIAASHQHDAMPAVLYDCLDSVLKSRNHFCWLLDHQMVSELVEGFKMAERARKETREEVWHKINYLRSLGIMNIKNAPGQLEFKGEVTEEEFNIFKQVGKKRPDIK